MNIDALRSFVTLNTEIAGNQTVTFGDDAKQQIVGLNGTPRMLGDAAKLELDQNTVLLKSRILTAVRDAVGTDQSVVFKNIESMLFGKLGKTGQFDPDKATKPLAMRDLQKIVKTLDKAGVCNPATIGKPQIAKLCDKSLMTDSKALLDRLNKNPAAAGDFGYEVGRNMRNLWEGVACGGFIRENGLPRNHLSDRLDTIFNDDPDLVVNLPDAGEKRYTHADCGNQFMPDLSRVLSGGKASKYGELSLSDKWKLQLALASVSPEGANAIAKQAEEALSNGKFSVQHKKFSLRSMGFSFGKDGGLSITCSYRASVSGVRSKTPIGVNDRGRPINEMTCQGNGNYVALSVTTTFTAAQLDKLSNEIIPSKAISRPASAGAEMSMKVGHFELHLD